MVRTHTYIHSIHKNYNMTKIQWIYLLPIDSKPKGQPSHCPLRQT